MKRETTRRDFLKASALLGGVLAVSAPWPAVSADAKPKRKLKKAIMWGTVGVKGSILEKFQAIKQAGFTGVEMVSHLDQAEVLQAREATGLAIPSVCCAHHWKQTLSDADAAVRAQGLASLQQALRDAKRFGASSVLLVAGKVGDGVSYEECWERSTAQVRKAIPLAEELGVKIAIENVWNNFITKADEAVRYVDQFKSAAVAWHFDVGNIVVYGKPEEWIPLLGKRTVQVHIKEFDLERAKTEGRGKGFGASLTEGSVNWPAVMKALDGIGYSGWCITEQPGGNSPEGLKDLADRLGKIILM